jgi:hypothetical protein
MNTAQATSNKMIVGTAILDSYFRTTDLAISLFY